MTHENRGSPADGLVVADPVGERFRIRWAKRGTQLRGGVFVWDGTLLGALTSTLGTLFGPAYESASRYESTAKSWKIGVYCLVPPPGKSAPTLSRERLRALVFKEKFRAVYKQRLEVYESPNGRVLELQEIIQAGRLQGLIRDST